MLRPTGSTGSLRCGLWRNAREGSASAVPDLLVCMGAQCAGHRMGCARGLGDETMLMLDGHAEVVDEDTGEKYLVKPGDVIAVHEGLNSRWTSKSVFMRKFWLMTNAELPAAST
jgi:hypothetical protein